MPLCHGVKFKIARWLEIYKFTKKREIYYPRLCRHKYEVSVTQGYVFLTKIIWIDLNTTEYAKEFKCLVWCENIYERHREKENV